MRIFCLSTGRCGSTTFTESFKHATNYTSGHESRSRLLGEARLDYPDWHIESDNRLSWFLGELDQRFGDDPIYVHLQRDFDLVVRSFVYRHHSAGTIMRGYGNGILMTGRDRTPREWRLIAEMYVKTVTANIELFTKHKTNVVSLTLEDPEPGVIELWERGGMEGDLGAALSTWATTYNADHRSIGLSE